MQINDIINNKEVSDNIKDIYKYLHSHSDEMDIAFRHITAELKGMFDTVEDDNNQIQIKLPKPIERSTRDMILDSINKNIETHIGKKVLNSEAILFNVYESDDGLVISRRY